MFRQAAFFSVHTVPQFFTRMPLRKATKWGISRHKAWSKCSNEK